MKVVIVGGVAGGASAAARLRRLDETAQIVVLERSGYVSYANCGLPYYVGDVIQEAGALSVQTPQSLAARFALDVRVHSEVTAIDPARKTVSVRALDSGKTYEESYDKLILAPGARPVVPNLPGVELERVFTLRTVEDTLRIRQFVDSQSPQSATVIGGGFIGLEMAENLRERGLHVTLVEKMDQLLGPLDADMASFVHAKFLSEGVKLLLGSGAAGFEEKDGGIFTRLDNAPGVQADMVVLAIGVAPDSQLARAAGLELGAKGSIAVNERMQTSQMDIYAVGDAVQIRHLVSGQETLVSLAGPANKQGRVAADNICGLDSVYRGAQGSSVIKLFDMTAAATGLNERAARAAGLAYEKIVLSPASHASYYPGGKVMTMKMLYEKGTLRLLGAQIVGFDGVDKRIDVLATAMQAGMSAVALKDLDLAYAPPFSSAKDPVNMAGFMAENIEKGLVKQFHYEDVAALPRDGSVTLLDARTPQEYAKGNAEGFVNIPVDELRARLGELEAGKPVYVMCQSGLRSYIACRILAQNGFECYNFSGGYRFYQSIRDHRFVENVRTSCGQESEH